MYILLILIHSLFIFVSHLFGFYVIEGVFLVLMLFFLLYFSPIFFFKNSRQKTAWDSLFSLEFSPQKSLIIPIILTYLGIYILAFTFSGNIAQSLSVHLLILLAIFVIFLGYIFSFDWKNKVFFHVLSFHLAFSYLTLFIVSIYYFFFRDAVSFIPLIFSLVTLWFSYFFFIFNKDSRQEFFCCFLFSIFVALEILLIYFFPTISLYLIVGAISLLAVFLFEASEKTMLFRPFLKHSRVFFLSLVLGCVFVLSLLILRDFSSIYFLIILIIFLFSVHIRFSNMISYSMWISVVYWLYGFLFISLLSTDSVFNSLLFLYFLPLIMIGNTYFWEEKQKYDFAIIHYASIGFSAILFFYSLVFLDWQNFSFIFSSFWFLFLAVLFFLSYFRFYKK